MMASRSMGPRHCVVRVSPASAITESPWLLLLPDFLPMAKQLFKTPSAFVNRIPDSKKLWTSSLVQDGLAPARPSSARSCRPRRSKNNRTLASPRVPRKTALVAREPEMQAQDRHRVIAIDGPAASGKSSVARQLARRLGFAYVNSGAMYRAVTWSVLNAGIDPSDKDRIAEFIATLSFGGVLRERELYLLIDNVDLTEHLHEDRVNSEVSRVSTVPEVRQVLVQRMRDYAQKNDLVVEGRDIGSVVFSDTPFKFYIDASPEVRAQRRAAQGHRDEIARRDQADSSRAASPLIIAKDADVIDTSSLTVGQVVDEIVRRLQAKNVAIR